MMNRIQNPIVVTILFWLLAAWGLCAQSAMAQETGRMADLNRKIADLSLMNQQLKDRLDQAQTIRTALAEQQDELTAEIRVLVKSLKLDNFRRAMEEQRIRYNVDLLRTSQTYLDLIDEKMNFYRTGRDRLSYLQSLAEDDIRMIATLSDLKTDALTTQISLVINRYLPDAHTIQIDPERVEPISAQLVWERLIESSI